MTRPRTELPRPSVADAPAARFARRGYAAIPGPRLRTAVTVATNAGVAPLPLMCVLLYGVPDTASRVYGAAGFATSARSHHVV
jgi:hypothetical protein